jgi:hypothetical protein
MHSQTCLFKKISCHLQHEKLASLYTIADGKQNTNAV